LAIEEANKYEVHVEICGIIFQINNVTNWFVMFLQKVLLQTDIESGSYEIVVFFKYALKSVLSLCVKYINERYCTLSENIMWD